jgi:hypothetical protein
VKKRWLVLSAICGALAYAMLPPQVQMAIRALPERLRSKESAPPKKRPKKEAS